MQVKDVNGEHVGTVDHLDGDQLKLTRSDSTDGKHHYVPLSQVESRDAGFYLNSVQQNSLARNWRYRR